MEDEKSVERSSLQNPDIRPLYPITLENIVPGAEWNESTNEELAEFYSNPEAWRRVSRCLNIPIDTSYTPNDILHLKTLVDGYVHITGTWNYRHKNTRIEEDMWPEERARLSHRGMRTLLYGNIPKELVNIQPITPNETPITYAFIRRTVEGNDIHDLASFTDDQLMREVESVIIALYKRSSYDNFIYQRQQDLMLWKELAKTGEPLSPTEERSPDMDEMRKGHYLKCVRRVEEALAEQEKQRPRYESIYEERLTLYFKLLTECQARISRGEFQIAQETLTSAFRYLQEKDTIDEILNIARERGRYDTVNTLQQLRLSIEGFLGIQR